MIQLPDEPDHWSRPALLLTLLIILATAATLLLMGREPICKCEYVKLWHGIVVSSENSQHLSDWYTPSHIIHGFLFYLATWAFARRLNFGWRLAIATVVECAWEIAENTNTIIERYREATISLDYFGDSVVNSVADIIAMIFGFWLASKLPVRWAVLLAISAEAFTIWMIRDGLALNVIMLLYPLEVIRDWQAGM